jgi:subtilase family serine protease
MLSPVTDRHPRIALILALLLATSPFLPSCDDGSPGGSDDQDASNTLRPEPNVNIDDLSLPSRRGTIPFTIDMELTLTTNDPRSDVTVFFEFGDGSDIEQKITKTRLSLTPDPADPAETQPEQRTISVQHTYNAVGTYQLRINAVDTTNSTDPDPSTWIQAPELVFDITVDGLADLQATSITADVAAIRPSEPFNIAFSVTNGGDDLGTAFLTDLYLVSRPDITADGLLDSSIALKLAGHPSSVSSLISGGATNETAVVTVTAEQYRNLARGTWFVAMSVDPPTPGQQGKLGDVGEENEFNNFRVSTTGLLVEDILTPPDLALVTSDALVAPTSTPLLQDLTVEGLQIQNVGEKTSDACSVSLFLSRDAILDEDDQLLIIIPTAPALEPDATWEIPSHEADFSPALTELGDYFVIVDIDPSAKAGETLEGRANNTQVLPQKVTVTGTTPRDIEIEPSDITVIPSTTFVGGFVEVGFRVKNNGTDDSGQFLCSVYLSADESLSQTLDIEASNVQVETLIADQRRTFNRFVNITPDRYTAGTYYPFVVCDKNGDLVETDEANNTIGPGPAITVNPEPQIDYTLSELTVTPTAVDITNPANDTITVTAQVCNEGTDPAEPPLVELRLSPDPALNDADPALGSQLVAVPSLAPGQCTTFEITRKADCLSFVSGYAVALEIDPDGQYNEVDETNNVAFAEVGGVAQQITVGGSRCFCADDRFDPPGGGSGNSTPATATDVTALLQPTAVLRELAASVDTLAYCGSGSGAPGERDLYRVDLIEGDRITVALNFNQVNGDLDLRLYDAADPTTPVAESLGVTGTETITFTTRVDPSTTMYVEVAPKNVGESNYYDLDFTVLNAPTEPDISFPTLTLTDGQNPFDLTNYSFSLGVSNTGRSPADVPVRVYLSSTAVYNPANPPTRLVTPTPDPEFTVNKYSDITLDFDVDIFAVDAALPAGVYYLIAVADPDGVVTESNEGNNVRVSAAITLDSDCPSDPYDAIAPNDSFATATAIDPAPGDLRSFDNLAVCNDGRDDYYKICVPADQNLNHVALYQYARSSNLSLTLYDAAQAQIATNSSSTYNIISAHDKDHTSCPTTACAAPETCVAGRCQDANGEHCVYARARITNNATRSLRYDLRVDTTAPAHTGEPANTTAATAESLPGDLRTLSKGGPGSYTNPSNDKDWYTIPIIGGTNFTVTLDSVDRNARVNYRVGTATSNPTAIYPTEPRALTAPGASTVTNTVFFEVLTTNPSPGFNRNVGYRLTIDGVQGIDLTARNATLTPTTSQRGGSTNVSWELANDRLDPTPVPVHFNYLLSTDATVSDDDIRLYTLETDDVSPGTVGALARLSMQQKVYFREAAPNNTSLPLDEAVFGDFQLIIDVNPEINPAGDREITEISYANNALPRPVHLNHVCVTDTFDAGNANANANPATATNISAVPFDSARLSVCASDVDYFRLTVPPGASYEVLVDGMISTANADLDLIIYADDGGTLGEILGFSTGTSTTAETVLITNASGSPLPVFIEVAGFQPSYTNVYFLSVSAP